MLCCRDIEPVIFDWLFYLHVILFVRTLNCMYLKGYKIVVTYNNYTLVGIGNEQIKQ